MSENKTSIHLNRKEMQELVGFVTLRSASDYWLVGVGTGIGTNLTIKAGDGKPDQDITDYESW